MPTTDQVTDTILRDRLRDNVYFTYMNYAFFIKGAVVAASAVAIVLIFAIPGHLSFRLVRVALWAASLLFSMVTITTWSRGSIFTSYRSNFLDSLLPLMMGIDEVVMFIVVTPWTGPSPLPDTWVYWYLAFSIHTGLAAALITNRICLSEIGDYNDKLQPVYRRYMEWIRRDRIGATLTSLVGALVFVVMRYWTCIFSTQKFEGVAGGLIGLVAVGAGLVVVITASKQHHDLVEMTWESDKAP